MGRNNEDLEFRVARVEEAVRKLVGILAQPGSPTAKWMRTTTGPNGKITVPILHPALEEFAPKN